MWTEDERHNNAISIFRFFSEKNKKCLESPEMARIDQKIASSPPLRLVSMGGWAEGLACAKLFNSSWNLGWSIKILDQDDSLPSLYTLEWTCLGICVHGFQFPPWILALMQIWWRITVVELKINFRKWWWPSSRPCLRRRDSPLNPIDTSRKWHRTCLDLYLVQSGFWWFLAFSIIFLLAILLDKMKMSWTEFGN